MKPVSSITLPLHRAGEPAVDFNDLWAQLGVPHERYAITVRRTPGKGHHHKVTLNDKAI